MIIIIIIIVATAGYFAIDSLHIYWKTYKYNKGLKNDAEKIPYDFMWIPSFAVIIYMILLGKFAGVF